MRISQMGSILIDLPSVRIPQIIKVDFSDDFLTGFESGCHYPGKLYAIDHAIAWKMIVEMDLKITIR